MTSLLEYYEIISGLTTIPECQAWSAKQSVKTQNIRGTLSTTAFMTHSSVVFSLQTTTMIIMVPVTTTTIIMVPVTIMTIPVLVLVHMSRKK